MVLVRKGCCFICLKAYHHAKDCESTKRCRLCNRKHHQSICDKATLQTSASTNHSAVFVDGTAASEIVEATTNTSNSTGGRSVLLQTACAIASGIDKDSGVNVRVLFDSGSQHMCRDG